MKKGANHLNENHRKQNKANGAKNIFAKMLMMTVLWSLSRCAPFVCDMQSASLAGKHQVEVTPGISNIQFAQEGSPEQPKENSSQMNGLQIAYGVSDKMDIRVRFEHLQYWNESITLFSVGPKFSLVKGRIALFTPIWFLGGTPVSTQPTLLFTIPIVKNKIEFNPAVKTIVSLGGYIPTTGVLVAWKAGFGFSTDLSKWAIRPEYGVVYDLSEKRQYGNYSIGLTLNLSQLFKK